MHLVSFETKFKVAILTQRVMRYLDISKTIGLKWFECIFS